MKKLVVSPSTAQTHTSPISGSRSISPWPAITPPAITTVSPGAIRPTKAPVSRKAMMPTSRYVQAPSVSAMSPISSLGSGSADSTPLAYTASASTASTRMAFRSNSSDRRRHTP